MKTKRKTTWTKKEQRQFREMMTNDLEKSLGAVRPGRLAYAFLIQTRYGPLSVDLGSELELSAKMHLTVFSKFDVVPSSHEVSTGYSGKWNFHISYNSEIDVPGAVDYAINQFKKIMVPDKIELVV